jgi:DNA-binding response OmpR family regulator
VLLDLMMPVMNGATFRWKQRWDPSIANVPVLVVSSVADGRKSAEILGAQGHLRKPFEASALLAKVEHTIAYARKPKRPAPTDADARRDSAEALGWRPERRTTRDCDAGDWCDEVWS